MCDSDLLYYHYHYFGFWATPGCTLQLFQMERDLLGGQSPPSCTQSLGRTNAMLGANAGFTHGSVFKDHSWQCSEEHLGGHDCSQVSRVQGQCPTRWTFTLDLRPHLTFYYFLAFFPESMLLMFLACIISFMD